MPTSTLPLQDHAAFLFDMDGTLLTSVAAAERVWARWARMKGLDVATFLPTIHGRRAQDTVAATGLPGLDVAAEVRWVLDEEMIDLDGIAPIAGAADFLAGLPAGRWAVVTSAPRELAHRRLQAAGLPMPPMMVTAEDVTHGKPAPDGFLLGAERLGVPPTDCLVFEDAAAGIASAEAAGADVLVITATHPHPDTHGHPAVVDFTGLGLVEAAPGRWRVRAAAGS